MMLNAIRRSPQGMRALHITVSCLAFAAYSVSGTASAQAQCTASGALGSAGDASTSQALEVVRDRRMQVAQSCPAGTAPGANGMCMPVAGSATVTSASAPNAQPPGQPKAKAPGAAAAPAPGGAPYGGLKDDLVAPPLRPLYGVWAEGYGDHERRTNVAPQDQSVRFSSYGVLSGVDHTYLRSPREGILIGALAGYNHTNGDFSAGDTSGGNGAEPKKQEIEGAMLGLYGTYFHGRFAIDVLAKTDLFDLHQTGLGPCNGNITGSTDLTNYVIAANVYYRHDLGHTFLGHPLWLEPMLGIRYVASQFGSGAAALGLDDGEALRLQAGARIGADWVSPDRRLWSVSFLAGIYSDVMVNGFTAPGGGGVTLATDEGKVRALGQLRAKVTTRDGMSYYVQAEARAGEDYWGVGGKAGIRIEW
jgi:outer membrane autotransporter protein